jgi:hypothetical protein
MIRQTSNLGGFQKRSIEEAVKITMRMQAPDILEPERQ